MLLIGMTLLLAANSTPVIITTYGIDDLFFGRRTASSWHNQTPKGAPEQVDNEYFGAASNVYSFGTKLRVIRTAECNGEALEPAYVDVVVVDRLATGFNSYIDLWPAPARALGLGKEGCALGEVIVL
jgi:hypothetical protein